MSNRTTVHMDQTLKWFPDVTPGLKPDRTRKSKRTTQSSLDKLVKFEPFSQTGSITVMIYYSLSLSGLNGDIVVMMEVRDYLSRIGFSGPLKPSLELLSSVHSCHLLSVPFENLSVHSGGRVQIDLPLLYDKIVNRRRGGFCFENNSLFSWLLTKLGFQVTVLSGQVKNQKTARYGPPFDHLILMVTLEGRRWLCDVGFGTSGFWEPLSLETSGPQEQGHRVYRVRKDMEMLFLEWQKEENGEDGEWTEVYKFTLEPRYLEDFREMCQYHQTSPCSLFFCKSLCTILKPDGRVTYIGHRLITTRFPSEATRGLVETTTRDLQEEEIPAVLKEIFGILLPSPLKPKDETITPPPVMY